MKILFKKTTGIVPKAQKYSNINNFTDILLASPPPQRLSLALWNFPIPLLFINNEGHSGREKEKGRLSRKTEIMATKPYQI
jgi:hypothetical protein